MDCVKNLVKNAGSTARFLGSLALFEAGAFKVMVGVMVGTSQVRLLATNALNYLCTQAWISGNTSTLFTGVLIHNPLVSAVVLKVALIVVGVALVYIGFQGMEPSDAVEQGARPSSFIATLSGISCELRGPSIRLSAPNEEAFAQYPSACLKVLTDCLRKCSNFNTSFYLTNMRAIDAGGPSRAFFGSLLPRLVEQERPGSTLVFSKNEEGYYQIGDGEQPFQDQDREVCQNMGTLIGAMLAGFVTGQGRQNYKLGNVFSPQFYGNILYLHQQRQKHRSSNIVTKIWRKIFSKQAEKKEKTGFSLFMAGKSPEHPLYGLPLDQLASFQTWTELAKGQLLTALNNLKERKEQAEDIVLPAFTEQDLQEPARRMQVNAFIEESVVEQYGSYYKPACAVLDGVEQIPGSFAKIETFLQGMSPSPGRLFAEYIQGLPFTRDAFRRLLPLARNLPQSYVPVAPVAAPAPISAGFFGRIARSVRNFFSEAPDQVPMPVVERPATGNALRWLLAWLQNEATSEECELFLIYVSGSNVIDPARPIHLHFNSSPGFNCHTCFNSLDVPDVQSKEELIAALRIVMAPANGAFNAA